jgi:cytoskeletal protein CcmA (bactofilin family)
MFRVGQTVRCKVIGIAKNKQSKVKVKLTLNPKEVNNSIRAGNLVSGMVRGNIHILDKIHVGLASGFIKSILKRFCETIIEIETE